MLGGLHFNLDNENDSKDIFEIACYDLAAYPKPACIVKQKPQLEEKYTITSAEILKGFFQGTPG